MANETKVYPEHEKLHAIKDQSQAIGECLEWLGHTKNWVLADEPHQHDPDECYSGSMRICDIRKGERIPASYNIQSLLAEYFNIDRNKLDAEKEEMLKELRAKGA